MDLLGAAKNQLIEVAKDAKTVKDPLYVKMMEQVDLRRKSFKKQQNPSPALTILAKDIGVRNEKEKFSPILKRWNPFVAGVAVATLHAFYGRELKQFLLGVITLTPESIQVLEAADKLEKDLVQIVVEDSVDCEDGGKGVIREIPHMRLTLSWKTGTDSNSWAWLWTGVKLMSPQLSKMPCTGTSPFKD